MYFKYILFLGSLILFSPLSGQLSVDQAPASLLPITRPENFVSQESKPPTLSSLMLGNPQSDTQAPPSLLSLKYEPHLAFFCRVEVKIDKAVGTPFRFRLGSVDYVDYLEGKRRDY